MKELNKKVFNTIFWILSIFIFSGFFIYNVNMYMKEYNNVHRNLTLMELGANNHDEKRPEPNEIMDNPNKDIENMMIMDYEVYTIKTNGTQVEKIISHSNEKSDFDIEKIANEVVKKEKKLVIGNLYSNNYSYNYMNNSIVIINTKTINNKLTMTLIESILLFIICEIIIIYISKRLTKRITKPAEEAFKKQKDFVADASHELKTPLAVIMASSDELKSDKRNTKYVNNIKHESERMNNLIKGLLDLSKLENEKTIETYTEENISKIIEKTSLIFEGIAFEENVTIETNIQDNIMFKCNKDEIERLISIIIDNAIKHSYKDSKIKVTVISNKSNIYIKIINTGDPIKTGDEEKIFERFYRADKSRNRDANRYGLGLAIAKGIVENHKGTIKASSKNNKTTFEIYLKK